MPGQAVPGLQRNTAGLQQPDPVTDDFADPPRLGQGGAQDVAAVLHSTSSPPLREVWSCLPHKVQPSATAAAALGQAQTCRPTRHAARVADAGPRQSAAMAATATAADFAEILHHGPPLPHPSLACPPHPRGWSPLMRTTQHHLLPPHPLTCPPHPQGWSPRAPAPLAPRDPARPQRQRRRIPAGPRQHLKGRSTGGGGRECGEGGWRGGESGVCNT